MVSSSRSRLALDSGGTKARRMNPGNIFSVDSKALVRVRFAPSPTGHLHVGNARTALFNWLYARQKRGTMILRVEDTDVARSEGRFEDLLIGDLKWLGLDWDEGPDRGGPYAPYRQSDRLEIYREHAERLLAEGKAYLCFCTEQELEQERERRQAEGGQPIYSGKCRKLDPEEGKRRRASGEACAIRLKIPDQPIRFHDMVHGEVEFSNEVVSDPIILRSNGMPVYNYVVVIDDALMKITHVIRGDDHLSNTPKQVALYEALGWQVPEFAHLSTILGGDRERLSKRHGATSIQNFRDMGVLPEALVNYLVLLGWAPSGGTREIFTLKDLVKEFSLERVTPSSAVFDLEKLYWLNRQYIKRVAPERINRLALPYYTAMMTEDLARTPNLPQFDGVAWMPPQSIVDWLAKLTQLFVPYVNRLDELPERASPVFHYDPKRALESPENREVLDWPHSKAVLSGFTVKILADESASKGQLTAEQFKAILEHVQAETGAKGKELFHPIRIVITGSHSGPDFDRLIPILEAGSHLSLLRHVLSVRERVEAFARDYSRLVA
jgi:nondiscriminating glutamyl-tRNA synthetase